MYRVKLLLLTLLLATIHSVTYAEKSTGTAQPADDSNRCQTEDQPFNEYDFQQGTKTTDPSTENNGSFRNSCYDKKSRDASKRPNSSEDIAYYPVEKINPTDFVVDLPFKEKAVTTDETNPENSTINKVPDLFDFGVGFDSLTRQIRYKCVDFKEPAESILQDIQTALVSLTPASRYKIDALQSDHYLRKVYDLNIANSFYYQNDDPDFDYGKRKSSAYSRYATNAHITASVHLPADSKISTQPYINELGTKIYEKFGAIGFRHFCGDQYIVSKTRGGDFEAILAFEAPNSIEQNEINNNLSISLGQAAGDKKAAADYLSTRPARVSIIRRGPLKQLPIQNNFAAFTDYGASFSKNISTSGKELPIATYGMINYGPILQFLKRNHKDKDNSTPDISQLETALEYIQQLILYRNDLLYLQKNPLEFNPVSTHYFTEELHKISRAITDTRAWGRDCLKLKTAHLDSTMPGVKNLICTPLQKPVTPVELKQASIPDNPMSAEVFNTHCDNYVLHGDFTQKKKILRLTGFFTFTAKNNLSPVINNVKYVISPDGINKTRGKTYREPVLIPAGYKVGFHSSVDCQSYYYYGDNGAGSAVYDLVDPQFANDNGFPR